jgi:hypothetical protein
MGILQVFPKFFEVVPEGAIPEPGHLYWAPTPEVDEVPRILDVQRATPDEHRATEFEITEVGRHHFKQRDRLPVKKLNLGETEELLIAKGKKRPVVIIAGIAANDVDTLPDSQQKRLAKHLGRKSYLVAPFYSVSTLLEPGTFGPVLVARIRAMQYLHFFCLPKTDKPGQPGFIVRLDRVFPTYLGRGCEPMGRRVDEEPFEIILSQFSLLSGAVYREPYDIVKDLVRGALPSELLRTK